MPNDILKDEFNNLRETVLELDRAERAYYILLDYKDMPVKEIRQKLRARLMTSEIRDDVKVSLTWDLYKITGVSPDYNINWRLSNKASIIIEYKNSLKAELLALFMKMMNSNNPEYIAFASGFLEDRNETSLYNQMLEYEDILKMQEGTLSDSESFPSPIGRG